MTQEDAIKIFLIAVKNGDITIFPNSDTTPDYVQLLENSLKDEG